LFSNRDVVGCPDKLFELLICYFGRVHPEATDIHTMDRPRVSHRIRPAANIMLRVSSLPIENSPPGIHTMPSGARPGGRLALTVVVANKISLLPAASCP
jgi:hypothetical protein